MQQEQREQLRISLEMEDKELKNNTTSICKCRPKH